MCSPAWVEHGPPWKGERAPEPPGGTGGVESGPSPLWPTRGPQQGRPSADPPSPQRASLGGEQSRRNLWLPNSSKRKIQWVRERKPAVVVIQTLNHARLFATPWTAERQASLSITNSRSLLNLMFIESVMPSNRLILCRPLLLLPSVFPGIRVFSSESVLCIRWPKYWSFL